MEISLKNKTALVSGSTQGIGLETAKSLASLGARVLLLARNIGKLKEIRAQLESDFPAGHQYAVADFADPDSVKRAVENLVNTHGPIHIVVNNTGGPPGGRAIDAALSEYLDAFKMHLICNQIIVSKTVSGMKREGYGRIINVISTSVKQPLPNLGVSNTIRGAVANWSKTLANELGPDGITVNNVLPGATATGRLEGLASKKAEKTGMEISEVIAEMGKAAPLGRVAQPQEIANAICFLASPAASYISGINLPVDGGRTACL